MARKVSQGTGVPRLQEVGFLEQAMRCCAAGGSYDDVRKRLIGWMEQRREGPASSGRYMGVRRKPGVGGRKETRFMDNATDALAELMRLGLLERSPLPTTANALPTYRSKRFAVTEQGGAWVEQLGADPAEAMNRLLSGMWQVHPQLAAYYRLLAENKILIPTLNWTDLFPGGVEEFGEAERNRYIEALTKLIADAGEEEDLGWRAEPTQIRAAANSVIKKRIEASKRRGTRFPYLRPQDFVRDCHKGIVGFSFKTAGVQLDFTSHEVLRRWGRAFGVANFSYHIPGRAGLRCWGTAELSERDGGVEVRRRRVAEFGDRVIEELPRAYERAREQRGTGGFVPVFVVRQDVCWQLELNGAVFDAALRHLIADKRKPPLRITLDRAFAGTVPPTESPLTVPDRDGRPNAYGLMMVTKTERTD